jgi:hypothetical protein
MKGLADPEPAEPKRHCFGGNNRVRQVSFTLLLDRSRHSNSAQYERNRRVG